VTKCPKVPRLDVGWQSAQLKCAASRVPKDCPAVCAVPQVLPVNDTCVYNMWWDSYPYSSLSVHALHPQYLALRATLEDLPGVQMPSGIAAAIEAARVGAWTPKL
jgi:hypothetical protein